MHSPVKGRGEGGYWGQGGAGRGSGGMGGRGRGSASALARRLAAPCNSDPWNACTMKPSRPNLPQRRRRDLAEQTAVHL